MNIPKKGNKFYKITLAYRGTAYHGWSFQKTTPLTIEETLFRTIKNTFNYESTIMGASRTDAGVHARGQVVKITLGDGLIISSNEIKKILNNHLPQDIQIVTFDECAPSFSPRYDCYAKEYVYYVTHERPSPFIAPFVWYTKLNYEEYDLSQYLSLFLGTHDFRAFCTLYKEEEKNTERTLYFTEVSRCEFYNATKITIKGNGFLRYMVRRIVGGSIIASHRKYTNDFFYSFLKSKNPQNTLLTAPAQGLFLEKIYY